MNRRGFLASLAAVAATAVIDPEALLWVPGKKTIFIPKMEPVVPIGAFGWIQIDGVGRYVCFKDGPREEGDIVFSSTISTTLDWSEVFTFSSIHPDKHRTAVCTGVVI